MSTTLGIGILMIMAGLFLVVLDLVPADVKKPEPRIVRALVLDKWKSKDMETPTVIGTTVVPAAVQDIWNVRVILYSNRDEKRETVVLRTTEKFYDSAVLGQILE